MTDEIPKAAEVVGAPTAKASNRDANMDKKNVDETSKGKSINEMSKGDGLVLLAMKLNTSISCLNVNDETDPCMQLLAQFTGIPLKPKKLLAGWQHWMNEVWLSLKPNFDIAFAASGELLEKHASKHNAFLIAKFADLTPEMQEKHTQAAIAEHKAEKQAIADCQNQVITFTPSEQQVLLKNVLAFLNLLLQGMSEALGMHISLFIGGPEPIKGEQLNVISLHHGKNKAPVPQTWATSDKERFKEVMENMLSYLEECYTIEEHNLAAMPDTISDKAIMTKQNRRKWPLDDSDEESDSNQQRKQMKNSKDEKKHHKHPQDAPATSIPSVTFADGNASQASSDLPAKDDTSPKGDDWFLLQYKHFSSLPLGPKFAGEWAQLLQAFQDLEAANGYANPQPAS
ncbi:hypothetical protein BDN71DRAFT_1512235 [Pleurotus eryngii]|uniref:Uncharacterized protein n=1 Tax=Pleurotus eryngii TaxID=5323 RepID=A0A9P5ZJQ3_PLEER|nr:hypothetical protein BDN71DRAFT_1513167 [Pleurotus eryngii]KAF9489333.1 hypothetical protein BDN71DRAFT_1512235 [Pleurotus eryngii]